MNFERLKGQTVENGKIKKKNSLYKPRFSDFFWGGSLIAEKGCKINLSTIQI